MCHKLTIDYSRLVVSDIMHRKIYSKNRKSDATATDQLFPLRHFDSDSICFCQFVPGHSRFVWLIYVGFYCAYLFTGHLKK